MKNGKNENKEKINLSGFVIVTTENYGRDTVFWTRETTRNSTWVQTDSDLRAAKIFKSEKTAQKFIDNYVKRDGHDIDKHVVVPISNYVITGYRFKNGKAVKVKCFEGLYSIEGRKDRYGSFFSAYTVYKTAAECIREETKDIRDNIRRVKDDIKRSTKELKDLEKQLKKLSAGV